MGDTLVADAQICKVAVGLTPSVTITSLMLRVGVLASLSKIVTIPMPSPIVALVGFVKVTVKVSVGSFMKSSTIGTVTFTQVCPAGIVAVAVVVV